jgi:hypothetical protein
LGRSTDGNAATATLTGADQVPPAFCPNCGVANVGGFLRCHICGQQFLQDDAVASLWDNSAAASGGIGYDPVLDLPDDYDRFADEVPSLPPAVDPYATVPYSPINDKWSSSAGTLGADPGTAGAFVPPIASDKRRGGGPPAFLLGLIGFLLIAAVGAAAAILVFGPLLGNDVESGAHDVVANALAGAPPAQGTIILTESQLRNLFRANSDEFGAISDPAFRLGPNGFTIIFNAPGYSGRITGDLGVSRGRIVVLNPEISGLAGRVIDVDAIAQDLETQVNNWLSAQGLKVQSIENDGNALTITTVPAI